MLKVITRIIDDGRAATFLAQAWEGNSARCVRAVIAKQIADMGLINGLIPITTGLC